MTKKCLANHFQVLVHNPRSYPELRSKGLVLGSGQEHFVSIAASHTEGSVFKIGSIKMLAFTPAYRVLVISYL